MLKTVVASFLAAAIASAAAAQEPSEADTERTARIAYNTFMDSCIRGVATGEVQVNHSLAKGMRRLEQQPPGLSEKDPSAVVLQVRASSGFVYLHLSPTSPLRCSVSVFGAPAEVLKEEFAAGLTEPDSPYTLKFSRSIARIATLDQWVSSDARIPAGVVVVTNPAAEQAGVASLLVTLSENH